MKHPESNAGYSKRFLERAKVLSESLGMESDRGCVLLGAEILSNDLESLFRSYFRKDPQIVKKTINPLFKGFNPLATFAARIDLAYSMGLIPRVIYRRLHLVRELRNRFAHTAGLLDFRDSKCKPLLDEIAGADKNPLENSEEAKQIVVGKQKLNKKEFANRAAFMFAIAQLSTIVEVLEEVLNAGCDIRGVVTAYEKNRTFEFD